MSKSHMNIKLSFASQKPMAELHSQHQFLVTGPSKNPQEPAKCSTYFETKKVWFDLSPVPSNFIEINKLNGENLFWLPDTYSIVQK